MSLPNYFPTVRKNHFWKFCYFWLNAILMEELRRKGVDVPLNRLWGPLTHPKYAPLGGNSIFLSGGSKYLMGPTWGPREQE